MLKLPLQLLDVIFTEQPGTKQSMKFVKSTKKNVIDSLYNMHTVDLSHNDCALAKMGVTLIPNRMWVAILQTGDLFNHT